MVEPKTAGPGGGGAEALSTLTRTTCSAERSWRARYSAAQERRSSRAYSAAKARVRVEHIHIYAPTARRRLPRRYVGGGQGRRGTFQPWGGRQPTPGAGGRPQGCCGLNARAAASDLLVEAGRYFSRYVSFQEGRSACLLYFLLCLPPCGDCSVLARQ